MMVEDLVSFDVIVCLEEVRNKKGNEAMEMTNGEESKQTCISRQVHNK